ncbi:MAG: response regulator transcription factor [Cyclobacteriaceae bacterium]|nr:response regulator transcription factor [Cyclobacteriaceae bacterium]
MRILIIEDEKLARQKLEEMLKRLLPDAEVVGRLESVKGSIQWLTTNPHPNLAFVDIQLSDNHSFEIFKKFPVEFPVIFTTAFDKYLLDSFEYNSVDYLLKPVTEAKLKRAIEKVKRLEHHFVGNAQKLMSLTTASTSLHRIIAKKGTEFITLEVSDIAYFYTEHKVVFVRDKEGRRFIVNENLSELESKLDKQAFFRINRKYISSLAAIERFKPENGKIKISLDPVMNEDIYVSKETAPEFRKWIGVN